MISNYNLICCDKYGSNTYHDHTYQHDSLGHYSWLDRSFISTNIQSFMQNSEILDTDINTSDHLPIFCTCNLPITETRNVYKYPYRKCTVNERWNKAALLSYFILRVHFCMKSVCLYTCSQVLLIVNVLDIGTVFHSIITAL